MATLAAASLVLAAACTTVSNRPKGKPVPLDSYVWPLPPDNPRVGLTDILYGRADVEAGESGFKKVLIGAAPQGQYDAMRQPTGVAIDEKDRILVADPGLGAILRFDRKDRRLDVFGTAGRIRLKRPTGVTVGAQGWIFVADPSLQQVVAFDGEGEIRAVYGKPGELENPTDSALGRDGSKIYVADSKGQKVAVFDVKSGKLLSSFGKRGGGVGEFNYPTSVAVAKDGSVYVVDGIGARVLVFSGDGEYLEQLGGPGTQPGTFARPKKVTVDESGLIYVTDAAFNNVQIFDEEFRLLVVVGDGGPQPGGFTNASGVAARGKMFAVVDSLGRRVQVFRFLGEKSAN